MDPNCAFLCRLWAYVVGWRQSTTSTKRKDGLYFCHCNVSPNNIGNGSTINSTSVNKFKPPEQNISTPSTKKKSIGPKRDQPVTNSCIVAWVHMSRNVIHLPILEFMKYRTCEREDLPIVTKRLTFCKSRDNTWNKRGCKNWPVCCDSLLSPWQFLQNLTVEY